MGSRGSALRRAIPALGCGLVFLAQAVVADQGLGIATSESPLVVDLSMRAPPPDQIQYLRLGVEVMPTQVRHPPRVRLVLDPGEKTWGAVGADDLVIGALSIFPWPPRDQELIWASFNLTQVLRRLGGARNLEEDRPYGRLRVAVEVVSDPRDPGPVSVRVASLEISRSADHGEIPSTGR